MSNRKKNNFILFTFHKFSIYDCNVFSKKRIDLKKDKVNLDTNPKANGRYISVAYGWNQITDSHSVLSSSLDSLVKILDDNFHKTLEILKKIENFGDKNIINNVNEIETLVRKDRWKTESIEARKQVFPDAYEKTEEAPNNYISEKDPEIYYEGISWKWILLYKNIA